MEIKRGLYPNCSEWDEYIENSRDKENYEEIREDVEEDFQLSSLSKEWD